MQLSQSATPRQICRMWLLHDNPLVLSGLSCRRDSAACRQCAESPTAKPGSLQSFRSREGGKSCLELPFTSCQPCSGGNLPTVLGICWEERCQWHEDGQTEVWGTASTEPEMTHGASAFAATPVIWHGCWTVPPCPVPKEALGNLSGHFYLLSWCLLSALQTLCVKG